MRSLWFALVLAVSGCAAVPIPKPQQAAATQSIDDARNAGAASIEKSRRQFETAVEEQREATRLMNAGAYREAELLFERAEADAQLALSLAHEAPLVEQANEEMARLQQLRSEP